MTDDDDLFATLGGSLMNDLLADLQVDEGDTGWLSLEELEKELAAMDRGMGSLPTVPEMGSTAASLVVNHAQSLSFNQPSLMSPSELPEQDAWSLTLQKFMGSSLEQDFLQADSAKKQLQQREFTPASPPKPPGLDLSAAEEYDVAETVKVRPPPGLTSDMNQQILEDAAAKLAQQLQLVEQEDEPSSVPHTPHPLPPTPQNSMSLGALPESIPRPIPPTPQNSVTLNSNGQLVAPTPPPSEIRPRMLKNVLTPHMVTQPPVLPVVPVAVPIPQQGPAWQAPPPRPTPPPRPVYCHPYAPPIPANALESRYMKARDIGYVVHSILKPILSVGTSPYDYDVQFQMRRTGGGAMAGPTPSKPKDLEQEMESRSAKAKEWSNVHGTLGHVAKTNVTRPRALIAQPVLTAEGGEQRQQRAALWKSRIYIDQAYLAFSQVYELWRTVGPGEHLPPAVQTHLVKLLKCLGCQNDGTNYSVDPTVLQLLLKLNKGRVLLARVLENALLPPASVQVLLPHILGVLFQNKAPNPLDDDDAARVDDRVFAILNRIIATLPQLTPSDIIQSVKTVQDHSESALSSAGRMQAVHALLQRGGYMAANDPAFASEWSAVETEFMNILAGLAG